MQDAVTTRTTAAADLVSQGPLVSVVIPAYNAAATLRDAIDSVLAQTYQHIELVVVNDGSSDATADVLRSYGSRIKAIHQPNGGLAAARNAGLARADGELIALFDADDICEPDRIAAQVQFLESDPDVMLCASDFSAFDADGPISESHIARYYAIVGGTTGGLATLFDAHGGAPFTGRIHDQLVWGNFLHPPTVMFRRSLLDSVGTFSRNLRNLCDYDWLLRVSRQAKIGVIPKPLIRYRLSPGQMSGDRNTLQVKLDLIDILEEIAREDASFRVRHRARFNARLARAHYDAAEHLAQAERASAWRHFRTAACLRWPDATQLPLLAKLLLPNALWGAARNLRSTAKRLTMIETEPMVRGLVSCLPRGLKASAQSPSPKEPYWQRSEDPRYYYGIWLKHLTLLHEVGMTLPATVAELGPGDTVGAGIAAVLSGVRAYHAFDIRKFASTERSAALVDGIAELVRHGDPERRMGWPSFDSTRSAALMRSAGVDAARAVQVRDDVLRMEQDGGSIRYHAPWNFDVPGGDRQYDLIFSHTVLEYVTDLSGCFARCARMLRPGGWMSHQVDLSSLAITRRWNGHLAYPAWLWRIVAGRRSHLPNGHLPKDYFGALKDAGFEIVWTARLQRDDGVPPELVSKRYRHHSTADLRCAGLFIIARLIGPSSADAR